MKKQSNSILDTIGNLSVAGFIIERVADDLYNILSRATGAVLQRTITYAELRTFETGVNYINEKHTPDITEKFKYTKPAHSA